jgi:hypothetical protein
MTGVCQMVYLHEKTSSLGIFWWALEWKMLIFLAIILRPFCLFYDPLVYFMVVWHILWSFGTFILRSFGIFFAFWCVEPSKDLATLPMSGH